MADLLSYGAGASQGLDKMLLRMMAEEKMRIAQQQEDRQQTEVGRSNLAGEELLGRQITSTDEDRKARTAETSQRNRELDRDRDEASTIRRIGLRPVGSMVTPDEKAQETKLGMPSGLYGDYKPPSMGSVTETGETLGASEAGTEWKGTEAQQSARTKESRLEKTGDAAIDAKIQQLENEAERLEQTGKYREAAAKRSDAMMSIAAHRENRLTEWGPPPVTVGDTSVAGGARVMPRSSLPPEGRAAPQPATERVAVDNYKGAITAIDEITKLGNETGWAGVGPVSGRVGSTLMGVAGVGDPKAEQLRIKISELQSMASFDRGGKTFTPNEKAMLEEFLASYKQSPEAAIVRLKQFKDSANRSLKNLGVTDQPPPSGDVGGTSDLYQRYLNRNKPK